MKTNLKVLFSVALIIPLFIISCRDEVTEFLQEKFLEKNSHIANLLQGISLKDGSYDNIIDGASCISIELPVTVYVNGLVIEVDSPEDIQKVKDRFEEFCDDDDNLEIEFPITMVFADFTEVVVNDQNGLNTLPMNVIKAIGWMMTLNVWTLNTRFLLLCSIYPTSLSIPLLFPTIAIYTIS